LHTGANMFLVSLIYTSEMTGSMDFMDILEVSRARNEREGITGIVVLQ